MLNISGLNQGVVIDHIQAGLAMKIYSYLNAKSSKMGKKDIIKIEGPVDVDLDILGVLDHKITINVIEDGKIIKKLNPSLPEQVNNVIKCINPRCITSIEQELTHRFKLTNKEEGIYRCVYCEQKFNKAD